jgi:hypothetical protein
MLQHLVPCFRLRPGSKEGSSINLDQKYGLSVAGSTTRLISERVAPLMANGGEPACLFSMQQMQSEPRPDRSNAVWVVALDTQPACPN